MQQQVQPCLPLLHGQAAGDGAQAWESGPAGGPLHRLRPVTGCLTVQQGTARLHLLLLF